MRNLNYYTEEKRVTIVYNRFRIEEKFEKVTMVDLGTTSMRLSEVKRHLFNERIGNWKMICKTRSEAKIKKELENNFDEFMSTLYN